MATINPSIISNPVFQSLQTPDLSLVPTSSTVLYANKYCGITPVEMDGELLETFKVMNLKLTGLNVRSQLEQLLNGYDSTNGPWFIDGKDGIIHIHNRKIAPPQFVYAYQWENGEVLHFQVTTNWVKGQVRGTLASQVTKDKTTEINLVDHDITEFILERPEKYEIRAGQDEVLWDYDEAWPNIWVAKPKVVRDVIEGKEQEELQWASTESYEAVVKVAKALEGERQANIAEFNRYSVANHGNSSAYEAEAAQNFEEYFISNTEEDFDEKVKIMNDTGDKGNLDPLLYREFEYGKALVDEYGEDKALEMLSDMGYAWCTQILNSRDYGIYTRRVQTFTSDTSKDAKTFIPADNNPILTLDLSGINLDQEDYLIRAEIGKRLYDAGFNPYRTKYGQGVKTTHVDENIMVAVREAKAQAKEGTKPQLNTLNIYQDPSGSYAASVVATGYYGTSLTRLHAYSLTKRRDDPKEGGSVKARRQRIINEIRNRQEKAKHKEIEVQLRVVGRPMLEAGQYIEIQNVSKRYSGIWYIKTCIHQFSSEGYTCSLTLIKNSVAIGTKEHTIVRDSKGNYDSLSHTILKFKNGVEIRLTNTDYYALHRAQQEDAVSGGNKLQLRLKRIVEAYTKGVYGDMGGAFKVIPNRYVGLEEQKDLEILEREIPVPNKQVYGDNIKANQESMVKANDKVNQLKEALNNSLKRKELKEQANRELQEKIRNSK